ncbi:hypothetical protein AOC36_04195 [Erysipelothrix larvae]|uniref:Cytotoxic translational repressor of toxin-antitoxin stability system n=1 Tax=Erysipelothrix larvae TaxID=1514105 RepID=A0A0X8GZE9_9FIRM|nr:hypothetical protein [Erysipelothrix larvae]AMC93200.1 hypothetical protein AOC36_04195 [Erysipelothrix larvae]
MTFEYSDEVLEDLKNIEPNLGRMMLDYFEKNYLKGHKIVQKKTHSGCVFYSGKFRFIYDVFTNHTVVYRVITE